MVLYNYCNFFFLSAKNKINREHSGALTLLHKTQSYNLKDPIKCSKMYDNKPHTNRILPRKPSAQPDHLCGHPIRVGEEIH